MTTNVKSGLVEFKTQRDIIADRQKKTDQQYRELQKRVGTLLKTNYLIAQSVKSSD